MNRTRYLWLALVLGGVVLTVSGLGTAGLISLPASEKQSAAVSSLPSAPTAPGVVCFGFVDLEHGCTPLYPLQPGRVAQLLVRGNQKVKAGDPLLVLEDQTARYRVAEARAALAVAQAQLEQARQLPEQHKLRRAMQRAAVRAADNRLTAARHALAHKELLAGSRLLSSQEVAAAAEQVKELEAAKDVEAKKLAELELHDPQPDVRRAEAEVALLQARLQQAEQALAEHTLRAPRDGTVVRILVSPGEVLALPARQAAVIFAANEPRLIRAEVEQEFASRVAPGMAVRVQDDTDARVSCNGKVTLVSDWYMQRRAIFQEPTRFNDTRTIECIITLAPNHPPLRIGQRVRVLIGAPQ
jgi:multidrug resistance efflux pump